MRQLTWSNSIDLDAELATYRQHVAATADCLIGLVGFYGTSQPT